MTIVMTLYSIVGLSLVHVYADVTKLGWSQSDCSGLSLPSGYDLSDITTPLIPPELNSQLETACATSGGSGFQNPTACSEKLYEVDTKIGLVYFTNDVDLKQIYKTLFGQCPDSPDMASQVRADIQTMDILNKTMFGNFSVTPNEPGLIRDLLSMLDGIAQIQSVANGQANSIRKASISQQSAAKQVQASLLATAQQISDQTLAAMQSLVGNRTLVQTNAFEDVSTGVKEIMTDIGQQADDIVAGFTQNYDDLSERYNTWKALSEDAIATTSQRSLALKESLRNAIVSGQEVAKKFKLEQSALVGQSLADSQADFAKNIGSAQSDMQASLTSAVTDMANDISKNRADYLTDASALEKDIQNQLTTLSTSVDGDAALNANNDAQSRQKADASISSLQTVIRTSILPLITDVLASMNKVAQLQNSVAAARDQIDADIASVRGPANQAAADLGNKIAEGFLSARTSFNSAFDQTRLDMQTAVAGKVSAGKSKLDSILGGVKTAQQGSTDQQQAQGMVTQAQGDASKTAADLTAAKETLASDKAKASLDTMVNFVSSALGDSQDTLSLSTKKVLQDISAAQGAVTAEQRQALESAYDRLQKEKADATERTNALRASSMEAQNDGQAMMSSIDQGATQLEGSVGYQTQQAQVLMGQIQDLLALAGKNGGSLEDQMTAFEKQAPSLVSILKQKIAAYKTLVTSQAKQAQAGAASAVSSGASAAIDGLTSYFQTANMQAGGVSSDLLQQQSATATDSKSLINDIQALNVNLQQQAQDGSNVVKSAAQNAMTQTMAQLQSVSGDSSKAISALLAYDSDLINRKKATILSSGNDAIDAATSAADYLTTSANNFLARSQSFINDATNVGNLAQMNMTKLVNDVNATLVQVSGASDDFVSRLSAFGTKIEGWKSEMTSRAAGVNLAIQQKVSEITALLADISGSTGTTDLRNSALKLQTYIDSLVASFEQQRTAFNDFAKKYTLRRLAVLTGLSEAVLAQKADFLASVGGADLSENERAARTTSTLQGLLAAVEKAKNDGDVNMDQVTSMIDKIGNGVSSLTNSLTTQMNTQVSKLKQSAIMSALNSGKSMGGSVDQTSQTTALLGNQFADALETVTKSETAAKAAAASSNKDVYSIAGLLENVSQETRLKVASLMKDVSAGKITMDEALAAAKDLNNAQINTVEDIINSLASYVGTHVATVNQFESGLDTSKTVIMQTVNKALASHEDVQADTIADLAEEQGKISALKSSLLGPSGTLVALENARKSKISSLEDFIHSVLHGTATVPAFLETKHRLATVAESIPDALRDAQTALASAKTAASTAEASLNTQADTAMHNAEGAIQEILSITASALQV